MTSPESYFVSQGKSCGLLKGMVTQYLISYSIIPRLCIGEKSTEVKQLAVVVGEDLVLDCNLGI